MLHIRDLSHHIAGRLLFDRASATINARDRVGIVGRNGSGKTTLLRMIAGDLAPEGGEISLPRGVRIGTLAQEAPSGPMSITETVLAADRERASLLREAEEASDPEAIAEVHERLTALRAASAPARAARILAGLGFDEEAQARACDTFSGGWRMRVGLAALLFSEPDLLLLDEPTNHLDLEATLWLEDFLASYPGSVVIVSHDRDLLNRAVTRILHLEANRLVDYSGNYDIFARTRRERLAHRAQQRAKQEAERRHMQAFVDRFRYKASKARQAQSRLKALARMEPIPEDTEQSPPVFDLPRPEELAPPIINIARASVGYDGRAVLRALDLRIDMDDRIALLGANGNGKSTLIKLLSGQLELQGGEIHRSPKLRIGYFAQEQTEELRLDATPLAHMRSALPREQEPKLRSHLARFGLGVDQAGTLVARLSGGERARLLFALATRHAPHLLLLDEPTNHLDMEAREALVKSLAEFPGAVILVSHDPFLVETVADRLWLVAKGTVGTYDGDLDDYRHLLLSAGREARGGEPPKGVGGRKDQRRQAAESRARQADLRKAVREAERLLETLQAEKARLEARLADPELYRASGEEVARVQAAFGRVEKALAAAEERWLTAQGALEEAEGS